jgi:enoyl-CoA hydratase
MEYENILYEKRDHVGIVTFNRPQNMNALAPGMHEEIKDVLGVMTEDDDVLCTILTGAGDRAFCAGAFVKSEKTHSADGPADYLVRRGRSPLEALDKYPKVVIAAVNGYAIGAGLNLVVLSDLVIASENASFGFPMTKLGIIPAYAGSARLAQWVGKGKAMEMALMSRRIDAQEAYRVGLANKVVPSEGLMAEAMAWAKEITELAPISVRLTKEDIKQGMDTGPDSACDANFFRFMATVLTEDRVEGHAAWRERREPVFKGR